MIICALKWYMQGVALHHQSKSLSNMFHTRSENVHFAHFDVAGFSYWEGCMVMHKLKIGTKVELVTVESNP